MVTKILISAMKDEATFIVEWVAYHRLIGFERIIVFSNESDDGTEELLDSLAAEGLLEHHRHVMEEGVSAQSNVAKIINDSDLIDDGDWVLWLDADEFLNVKSGSRTVDDLVDVIGDKEGMLINWRIFGTSKNAKFSGRHISSSYVRCSRPYFDENRQIKTFFKASDNVIGLGVRGNHRPKLDAKKELEVNNFICGKGEPLSVDYGYNGMWLKGDDSGRSCYSHKSEMGWGIAQINHYIVRSPEYFALKNARGRGWASGQVGDDNMRHTLGFYKKMNRNEKVDDSILFWEDRLIVEIEQISSLQIVNKAITGAAKKTEAAIRRIQPFITEISAIDTPTFPLTLPAAESKYLKSVYETSNVILEYGSGGSTVLAAELDKTVFSVESDAGWAVDLTKHIAREFPNSGKVQVVHVNIGKTKAWGYPANNQSWNQFYTYPLSVWTSEGFEQPDVVLIDGRFRTACFAAVLLGTKRKVKVLFDDYIDRPEYAVVEEFEKPTRIIGRMALFEIEPRTLTNDQFLTLIGWFSKVK